MGGESGRRQPESAAGAGTGERMEIIPFFNYSTFTTPTGRVAPAVTNLTAFLPKYLKMKTFLFSLCALALTGTLAPAQTIYSNISGGYDAAAAGSSSSNRTFFGAPFTATGGGNLSNLTTGATFLSGAPALTLGLYASAGGQPGALLESFAVTLSATPTLFVLNSVLHPFLAAGTQYWVVWTQTSSDQVSWLSNDTGTAGGVWGGNSIDGLTQSFPTFPTTGVRLTAGPAPTVPDGGVTLGLLALGAGGLLALRRVAPVAATA